MSALNRTVVAPLSSAIIAVLLAGLVVVGVDQVDRGLRQGEARLETNGIVEVAVAGAPFVRASRNRILGRGDRVRVIEGGAVLELPSASGSQQPRIELRKGSAVAVGGGDPALMLEAGDLLVQAPQDTVRIEGGTVMVSVAGSAKLRRAFSLAAGVYDGNVTLESGSRSIGIPRFRQAAAIGSGLLPDAPEPLGLVVSDEWDREMLPGVLALDQKLEVFGREFEAAAPAASAQQPGLYRAVVPGLSDAPLTAERLQGRFPGENVIGLVLVALDSRHLDFATRWDRIFGFRSEGASWGLVAADRGLNPNPVLNNLEAAVGALSPDAVDDHDDDDPVAAGPFGGGSRLRERIRGIVDSIDGGEFASGGPITVPTPSPAPPTGDAGTPPVPSPPPSSSPPPSPRKRIDVPSTGTVLDPVLDPVLNPLETLLSGVLDTLVGPAEVTATVTVAPTETTTEPAPATATSAPTTTTTVPSGGLIDGLTTTVDGLTTTVGGLLGG